MKRVSDGTPDRYNRRLAKGTAPRQVEAHTSALTSTTDVVERSSSVATTPSLRSQAIAKIHQWRTLFRGVLLTGLMVPGIGAGIAMAAEPMAASQQAADQQSDPPTTPDTKTANDKETKGGTNTQTGATARPSGAIAPSSTATPKPPVETGKPPAHPVQTTGTLNGDLGAAAADNAHPVAKPEGFLGSITEAAPANDAGRKTDSGDFTGGEHDLDASIKPTNYNGAFVGVTYNRVFTLLKPLATLNHDDGKFHASVSTGSVRFQTRNELLLEEGGVNPKTDDGFKLTGFNPYFKSINTLDFNLVKADAHVDQIHTDNTHFTWGASFSTDAQTGITLYPTYEKTLPISKTATLFNNIDQLGGSAKAYEKFSTNTNVGRFTVNANVGFNYYVERYTSAVPAHVLPSFSPIISANESWRMPNGQLTVTLSEQIRPAEQYQRYSISAVHPLTKNMDVGLYAGHQESYAKPTNFLGAGLTVHF